MTAAANSEDVYGPGWAATVTHHQMVVAVAPSQENALQEAVEALVGPLQRRWWSLEWIDEKEGWDIFLVTRT